MIRRPNCRNATEANSQLEPEKTELKLEEDFGVTAEIQGHCLATTSVQDSNRQWQIGLETVRRLPPVRHSVLGHLPAARSPYHAYPGSFAPRLTADRSTRRILRTEDDNDAESSTCHSCYSLTPNRRKRRALITANSSLVFGPDDGRLVARWQMLR